MIYYGAELEMIHFLVALEGTIYLAAMDLITFWGAMGVT